MLKIKDLKTLMKLKTNNKAGEIALVEETRTLYKWDGDNWNIHKPEGGINVSLFELNQSAMTAAPAVPDGDIEAAKEKIRDFVQKFTHARYFMLLSNERRYYTLFNIGHATGTDFDYDTVENEVIKCLQNQGVIKDITFSEDNIEFWVTIEDISYVYYLFNYDLGVIKCQ